MDGLTNRQRAAAWLASWNPDFVGKAIVNEKLEITAVNEQFCEILGITPAEVLESKFTDVTAKKDRELDLHNAQLVMKGLSPGYLMEKSYLFRDGREVRVLLMVVGIFTENGDFDFFVSRIVDAPKVQKLSVPTASPKAWSWLTWMKDAWKVLTVLVPIVAWVIYEVAKLVTKGQTTFSLPL